MQDFSYQRPQSLAELAAAFDAVPEARPLAGGMTLIPTLKLRLSAPPALLDLAALPALRGIRRDAGTLSIGAMTRHAEVATSADVRAAIPALAALAGGIGDPQVRHRGTLGGSIANNDPAADYPAALLALGATVHTTRRALPAAAFFTGLFQTALQADEIVTAVDFPVAPAAAYEKFRSPASRYALVGVFVARTEAGVRVAVTGAGAGVFRAGAIESALSERFVPQALDGLRFPADGLNADLHADADYRAHLITVLARRAVQKVLAGAAA